MPPALGHLPWRPLSGPSLILVLALERSSPITHLKVWTDCIVRSTAGPCQEAGPSPVSTAEAPRRSLLMS